MKNPGLTLSVGKFRGMILAMRITLYIFWALAVAPCSAVAAGAPFDRVAALQDENFFLQDEIRKLKADLADKDAAIRSVLLAKETAVHNEARCLQERTSFEVKVDALQKMVLERDREFPRKLAQAALPYRVQMEDLLKEQKVMAMAMEQKNARLAATAAERQALEARVDMLTGEKISLRESLRRVADELDALKRSAREDLVAAKNASEERLRDLQARLGAEQTLVQEKIALATKPFEDKLAAAAVAARSALAEAARKADQDRAPLRERITQLEKEIALLRENERIEIKKCQEQRDACREAAVPQK